MTFIAEDVALTVLNNLFILSAYASLSILAEIDFTTISAKSSSTPNLRAHVRAE